jgi:hypothetical protein
MPDPDLPPEVRGLVIRQLHSMEEIEALLLLVSEPSGLTGAEIRERLRLPAAATPPPSVARLIDHGFVRLEQESGEPRYFHSVTDPETKRAIDLLRVAYNERPVTLVRLVYNRPSAAQNFADAFRITKDST